MLKEHPKGLYIAFFANMGERFGFYTMVAIFILFMQAKYGLSAAAASQVYGIFMASVYFLPVVGGLIADRIFGYGKTISIGLITMFLGYLLLSLPSQMGTGFGMIVVALAVIALGTGLFKGNLQALVGNLYDAPQYSSFRDRGFNIFYMGINIGAMFAPTAAEEISNWILAKSGFFYDARIPAMAHSFLRGKLEKIEDYLAIAQAQDPSVTLATLKTFSESYINSLSKSYHYGFGVACISLVISMLVFWIFRKYYQQADMTEKQKIKSEAYKDKIVELTPEKTRQRMIALFLVFFVVIFFWMSFHQSGLTMTYFARDYTMPSVGKLTNLWFDLFGLLPIFLSVLGALFMLKKNSTPTIRLVGAVGFVLFAVLAYLRFNTYQETNPFTPQKFQHFNPFFIVVLTPIIIGLFSYLNRKGIEPSAPRKIGIGMLITACSFAVLSIGSMGLASPKVLGGQVAPADMLVSPYWLISTYFIITIAELFTSPMGISFVSRVSPPKYKGMMQGFWFAATATGNYLLAIIGALWMKVPLWLLWAILAGCCLISATVIFSIMKRLERATK
ncbi:MAG: MFS transporter [Candidatus Fischerbacteria bacterium RBG_13_37_8]|uniref:MFS transporter n=1 Tax=Candidatus Fischerbacteria bacterium RBG_13_37_8 TaxID=1817863 RepID=A0A1F5VX76_9BACT|nr:MAG: MFS transporter [Candidatus Fischerbacteria bacterium RBG_13_37_8]